MNFNLDFNEQELNLILVGLGKLPAEQVFDLIIKIKGNAQDQISHKGSAKAE